MTLVYFILNILLFLPYVTKSNVCDAIGRTCSSTQASQCGSSPDPDLTCGALNHPCVTTAFISGCDVKCDYATPCYSNSYNVEHNIFCYTPSSCANKQIYSCNDNDQYNSKSYICCIGEDSCKGASSYLHSPDDDIYCGGLRSCSGATIVNIDDDIHCQGQEACSYAVITACDDDVFCGGYESCKYATITTNDDNIECCNTFACSYAKMTAMEQVKCTGYQSCLHSTIKYQINKIDPKTGQYNAQTLNCVYYNGCDQLIASCTNNYMPNGVIVPCTVILPSRIAYSFMYYADRTNAYDPDPRDIYYYQYFTLRFQLKLLRYPPSYELYPVSLSSQPANNINRCFYPQIKISSHCIYIIYGCGYHTSPCISVWNDYANYYPVYVHIVRDFTYGKSTIQYYVGTFSGSFVVYEGYDNGASGIVVIYTDPTYFDVKQVIINSMSTYIAYDAEIPETGVSETGVSETGVSETRVSESNDADTGHLPLYITLIGAVCLFIVCIWFIQNNCLKEREYKSLNDSKNIISYQTI